MCYRVGLNQAAALSTGPGDRYLRAWTHTIFPGNNMCQKCGRKIGLWVLHEIVNKTYAENMKKIVDAVRELPAKQHS